MKTYKKTAVALCAGISACAITSLAHAQSAPADSNATKVDEVIVTGSRVITNGNNSPSPVTVATVDQLLAFQPTSVVQALTSLPGLLGSISSTSSPLSGGIDTVNLRGVGTLRGLILFDGHRVGPTQNGGAVTTAVIPQMLLQRVDVVTGGASAVYGSDAISGVLNFITDSKFNGLKFNIQDGISTYNDDQKFSTGIAVGRDVLDGRGHIEASYEYRSMPGLPRTARDFFLPIQTEQGSVVNGGAVGSQGNPYKLLSDTRLSTSSFGGLINSGPLAGLNFTQNGLLSPFVHGTLTGTSGVELGGDGAYYTGASIDDEEKFNQAFARFDYNFSDNVHGFVEAAQTKADFSYTQQSFLLNRLAIGYNNAFLSTVQPQYKTTIAAQLAAAPLGSFQLSKMDTLYPVQHPHVHEDYYMVVGGLDGSVGKYKWDLAYVRTNSEQTQYNENGIDNARLYASLNAVVNPANGQVVCNAALVNPSVYSGCVPLNVFGPTSESQAALDYIRHVPHSGQFYKTDDVTASLTGSPFSLPAGPVAMALSAEWRKLSYHVDSDSPPTTPVNCTGIQFNCTATSAAFQGGSTAILKEVSQTVTEVAYEANVPILANAPFAKELNLNGAARYTNYNTSGSVTTWKVGVDWKVNDQVTLRATRSRDIRAPNLSDLFAPRSVGQSQLLDIHTGATGVVPQIGQGNPNLTPEKSDTTTAGIVVRPDFVPGFSLAIDAYRIQIHDAILTLQPFQPATEQACEASNGTSSVCSLYDRPFPFSNRTAANYPTAIYTQSLNVAAVDTYGVDVEANYAASLFDRPLTVRALFNWQPHLIYDNGPAGKTDVGGAADGVAALPPIASLKLVASASYVLTDAWTVRLQERWRGPLEQTGAKGLFFADGKVPGIAYTDVTLTYEINKALTASLNIQNLFNKEPPAWASSGGSLQPNFQGGFTYGDDIIGRYYTLGLKLRL